MKDIYYFYGFKTLQSNDIQWLISSIQAAVQQEVTWFSKSYNKPQTVSKHPSPSLIEDFQKMLYFNRYDKICEENGMTAMELAMVCVNRWISSDSDDDIIISPAKSKKDINPVVAPIEKSLPVKEKKYKCCHCDSLFTRKFTLKRHIRTKHTNQQSTTGNCCCHDCGFKCQKITELRKHLAKAHNVIFRSETIILENMND